MWNLCLIFHIWCFIRTCLEKFTSDVSDDKHIESWSDTTFNMTIKTSFNILCPRALLQKHSFRICWVLWGINEVKVWNSLITIKRRTLLHKTCFDIKEGNTCCSTQHASFREWTLCMRKEYAFNASIKCPQRLWIMQVLMMSKRICLIMIVIIKKVENVNVWIHDFDDAKRIIKQGCFQDYFNKHSKVKHCFNINTRLHKQTSIASWIIQDQASASKHSISKTSKALVIDYQVV